MTEELNSVETDTEISVNVGGEVYTGFVTAVFDENMLDDDAIVELEIDTLGGVCISIVAEYVGEDGLDHYQTDNGDYEIYADSEGFDDKKEVIAFIIEDEEPPVPNLTVEDLDDDELAEIQPEFESAVDKLERGLTEIQEMRKAYNGFLEGQLTLVDVHERLEHLALQSGGVLVLDRGL